MDLFGLPSSLGSRRSEAAMSRRVSDDKLEALHLRLISERKQAEGRGETYWATVLGHDLACIIDELRQRRQKPGKAVYGPATLALAAMDVGDVITLPSSSLDTITNARDKARKLLAVPSAVWAARRQPDRTWHVERRQDGSPRANCQHPKNPQVHQLAAMKIGNEVTLDKALAHLTKVQARQRMGLPEAQWKTRKLNSGRYKVRRIS